MEKQRGKNETTSKTTKKTETGERRWRRRTCREAGGMTTKTKDGNEDWTPRGEQGERRRYGRKAPSRRDPQMGCEIARFNHHRDSMCNWAHGVVVSHPLSMREALGSIPSASTLRAGCKATALRHCVRPAFLKSEKRQRGATRARSQSQRIARA